MVREFLEGIPPQRGGANAFHMESLLQEMRELEIPAGAQHRFPIQPGPNVAAYALHANNWAEEYLEKEAHIVGGDEASASGWSKEFLDQPRYMGPMGASAAPDLSADWESQWDNLTSHVEKPASQKTDLLAQTAGDIVNSLSDPKFAQSEVKLTFLLFLIKL